MQVYQLNGDSTNYQTLALSNREDVKFEIAYFARRSVPREAWRPLEIEVLIDEASGYDGRTAPPNDFPTTTIMPIFSRRAVAALGEMLTDNGTLLPLIYEGETGHYYAFDVTRIADALDEADSEIKRFDDGRVMHVVRYEFQPHMLKDLTIFRIPQQNVRKYVTDEFVRRVEAADLTGFEFKPLWSSESVAT